MSARILVHRPPAKASAVPARPDGRSADGSPPVMDGGADIQRAARFGHDFSRLEMRPDPPKAGGGGLPLPGFVRAKMESALGTDLSRVRIHRGGPEAESIGAVAYTRGRDVHFADGQYDPTSLPGQRLLGHELAHVAQQQAGRVRTPGGPGAPINADPSLEAEADDLGVRAARGEALAPDHAGGAAPEAAPLAAPQAPLQAAKEGERDTAAAAPVQRCACDDETPPPEEEE